MKPKILSWIVMLNPDDDTTPTDSMVASGRMILLSLVIATSVVWIPSLIAGLLLIDIGQAFGQPVGVVGQIFTIAQIVGVATALILGVLSVRFKHKTLLTIGLLSYVLFSIGCSLAPNFTAILMSYSLSGIGLAIVMPMSMAIIGEHLPLEKRASAIGWISISTSIFGIIAGPLIGLTLDYGGWRIAFIVFVLPLSLAGLITVLRWLPSGNIVHSLEVDESGFFDGFTEIFSNRSALACLIGYTLSLASMIVLGSYCPSYLRERFLVSAEFVSNVSAIVYIGYSLGSAVCGRLVDRFGRKPLLVSTLLIESILIVSSTSLHSLWLSLSVLFVAYTLMGVVYPVAISLTLEQVPEFRGPMMSLNSAAGNLGMALGSGVGGMVILVYGYGLVGISFGALGILGTLIYHILVIDPTRT